MNAGFLALAGPLGFCFHLLSCIMDWLLLLPWIISTLGMNHTAYNGSAARSSHQPWEDTATGSELGLLSARSNCLVNGKVGHPNCDERC